MRATAPAAIRMTAAARSQASRIQFPSFIARSRPLQVHAERLGAVGRAPFRSLELDVEEAVDELLRPALVEGQRRAGEAVQVVVLDRVEALQEVGRRDLA